MTNRKIKEVSKQYFEEVDSEGVRRIRVETTITIWFSDSETGTRHNPTVSSIVEYL